MCPPKWHQFRRKCVFINETEATFQENLNLCRSLNATMVSIHSRTENKFIASLTNSSRLGAIKLATDVKSFVWIDGSPFNFSNWATGQPDDKDVSCISITIQNRKCRKQVNSTWPRIPEDKFTCKVKVFIRWIPIGSNKWDSTTRK
ncbi:low affinity immunoglobulin epsilon Fc receptor-like protein [Dinothrombium tinctorium]|uniref:Low affinity immunoglobulin epsilon Fc receptor-like protein n=1 Tax=Dinothrombium tinctorium TaxID=1965070 RepID=A0A443RDS9_9ACAR|nr:low affinity immunoglobulin epsilon Fc receptor-like protein [Dinothrombium tinctorium]